MSPSSLTTSQKSKIQAATQSADIYIDGAFTSDDFPLFVDLGVTGVVLKGGAEEKVGFKSYEELDDVLEAIYEE